MGYATCWSSSMTIIGASRSASTLSSAAGSWGHVQPGHGLSIAHQPRIACQPDGALAGRVYMCP